MSHDRVRVRQHEHNGYQAHDHRDDHAHHNPEK
jgi:hypothetical protein